MVAIALQKEIDEIGTVIETEEIAIGIEETMAEAVVVVIVTDEEIATETETVVIVIVHQSAVTAHPIVIRTETVSYTHLTLPTKA